MDTALNQEEFEEYSECVQKTNALAVKLWSRLNPSRKIPVDTTMHGMDPDKCQAWDLACIAVRYLSDADEDPESWVDLLNDHLNGQSDPDRAYKDSLDD